MRVFKGSKIDIDMEKLNIAELLKDCPKGTKLYNPIYGDCILNKVANGDCIEVAIIDCLGGEDVAYFTKYGLFDNNFEGECLLWPSKDHRTWEDWDEYKVNCLPKLERSKAYSAACEILGIECGGIVLSWDYLHILGKAWNKIDGVTDDNSPRYYPIVSEYGVSCQVINFGVSGAPASFKDEKTAIAFGEEYKDTYLKLQ